ncbi:hypothetical protein J3D56_004073 [Erwinia persicina]|jgi:hypothetical protein|uniref:Uncharacterized protein n=1 Tax=Erwinia aeris TaxID=3239803 RepID=A0ABV4E1R0_9GAMM|nr:hypothetical protein [Erwinia persicina]MCP1440637.1 hypothetical protein [Erwinia persicina]
MNSAKSSLSKLGKIASWGTSHFLEAMITGLCSIAAFLSLFLLEGGVMKTVGFVGFFVLGYLLSLGLGLLRGER